MQDLLRTAVHLEGPWDVAAIADGELTHTPPSQHFGHRYCLRSPHPLLSAFVFGVLLSRPPPATVALKERIQALTVSFFGPIFFGLAGTRVNLFDLHGV